MDKKCVNCGTTSTLKWRRLCDACSSYYKKGDVNQPLICQLPIKLRHKPLARMDLSCTNCQTNTTFNWRHNAKYEPLCSACSRYIQRYKVPRPPDLWEIKIPSLRLIKCDNCHKIFARSIHLYKHLKRNSCNKVPSRQSHNPHVQKETPNPTMGTNVPLQALPPQHCHQQQNSNSSKSPPLWRPWFPPTNYNSSSSNIVTNNYNRKMFPKPTPDHPNVGLELTV